jgi:hypothetical protein
MQQCARSREVRPAPGIGEQAVVADAMKAAGQHMQQEATHKLIGTERHHLAAWLSTGQIVLPAEGDALSIERNESLIGNRHPLRAAGKMRLSLTSWPLG